MLQYTTTIINIRDGSVRVETGVLTRNSSLFRHLLEDCKYEDHDMSDFDPDAVRFFIRVLQDEELRNLESRLFRDINKMAIVFEVKWLEDRCRKWLAGKIETVKNNELEEKTFLFDECYFLLKRLRKSEYMEIFTNQFGQSDNTDLLSKYLSNFENLEIEILNPLLQLGGSNAKIFFETLSKSVAHSKNSHLTLSKNALHLLQIINIWCFQTDWERWSELFDEIADLPEMSVSCLRIIRKLEKEVLSADRTSKNKPATTILYDRKTMRSLYGLRYRTVYRGQVGILRLDIFSESSPSQREISHFISYIETLCEEEKMQRVPWQIIDPLISASEETAGNLVKILTGIRQSKVASSPNRENIVIREDRWEKVNLVSEIEIARDETPEKEVKRIYKFKHPGVGRCTQSGECGFIIRDHTDESEDNRTFELVTDSSYYMNTGVHYHDIVSARDMCSYTFHPLTLPHRTEGELEGPYVAYNVSDYMVAKCVPKEHVKPIEPNFDANKRDQSRLASPVYPRVGILHCVPMRRTISVLETYTRL